MTKVFFLSSVLFVHLHLLTCKIRNKISKMNNNTKFNKTIVQPFLVADKETCNQKVNKDMNDIKGRTKRVTNAFYRWSNHSGSGIKEACLFEATLR